MTHPRHGQARRSGLTLLETLVVIVIGTILLALLVVGLMASRESARRMECQSHLRQIALAMTQHSDAHNEYFTAFRMPCHEGSGIKWTNGFSQWLPELGLRSLYDAIPDCHYGTGYETHPEWEVTQPAFFRCPSDDARPGRNYRLNFGSLANSTEQKASSRFDFPPFDGPFGWAGTFRRSDMTAGLSQIVGISEKLRSTPRTDFDPQRHLWIAATDVPPDRLVALCRNAPADPQWYESESGSSWSGHSIANAYYNHFVTPNWNGADCSAVIHHVSLVRATSHHTQGVNTARLDGSVHFVANSIDLELWQSLARRGAAPMGG